MTKLPEIPASPVTTASTVQDAKDVLDEFRAACPSGKNAASLSNPHVPAETTVVDPNVPFPESDTPPRLDPCSYNKCAAGHIWPAVLAIGKCPGCTGAVVAVQKVNCPVCNEPIVETSLRSDFVPSGAGISARCRGVNPAGESLDIQLQRTAWQEVEANTKDFLTREAEERAAK